MWVTESWNLEQESGWFEGRDCREGVRDSVLHCAFLAWLCLKVEQVEI